MAGETEPFPGAVYPKKNSQRANTWQDRENHAGVVHPRRQRPHSQLRESGMFDVAATFCLGFLSSACEPDRTRGIDAVPA